MTDTITPKINIINPTTGAIESLAPTPGTAQITNMDPKRYVLVPQSVGAWTDPFVPGTSLPYGGLHYRTGDVIRKGAIPSNLQDGDYVFAFRADDEFRHWEHRAFWFDHDCAFFFAYSRPNLYGLRENSVTDDWNTYWHTRGRQLHVHAAAHDVDLTDLPHDHKETTSAFHHILSLYHRFIGGKGLSANFSAWHLLARNFSNCGIHGVICHTNVLTLVTRFEKFFSYLNTLTDSQLVQTPNAHISLINFEKLFDAWEESNDE